MTGTQAAEKEIPGSRADKLHRGRNVVLAFTMQVCLALLQAVCLVALAVQMCLLKLAGCCDLCCPAVCLVTVFV